MSQMSSISRFSWVVVAVFLAWVAPGCLFPESQGPMFGDVDSSDPPDILDPDVIDPEVDVTVPPPDGGEVDVTLPPDGVTPPPVVPDKIFDRVAMSPDGRFVVAQMPGEDGGACLSVVDLEADGPAGQDPELPCNVRDVAFSVDGSLAYLLTSGGNRVDALFLETRTVVTHFDTTDTYSVIDVAPDGAALALSNRPSDTWSETQYEWNIYNMEMRHLAVIGTDGGPVFEQTFPYAIRSVAFSPVDKAVLVTMSWWKEDGLPEALVHFMNPATGVVETQLAFPNCADDLKVQPGGKRAILSPNQCMVHPLVLGPPPEEEEDVPDPEEEWDEWDEWDEADPCSVIDLEKREFLGNLPGFGPVAFTSDGQTAVAFSRQETMMKQWNTFQEELVGLIFIRMEDLYWKVVNYGADEPDYFFEPSDKLLFLHDREGGVDRVLRMDAATHEQEVVEAAPVRLDERAMSVDGQTLYVASGGALHAIPVQSGPATTLSAGIAVSHVFVRPQGDFLVAASLSEGMLVTLTPAGQVLDVISL